MDFEVDRGDLHRTRLVDEVGVALAPGQARLRVDCFALTSNNITYAVFGDAMRYWDFFPAASTGWGRIPVWGYADVVESTVGDVAESQRVYGYLPMSTELIVTPGRVDEQGFTDVAERRAPMASAYNRYLFTGADPTHDPADEPFRMLLWPLFFTSFVVDDFLGSASLFGARRVVVSSASSKTAIGTAHLLARRPGVEVVGLTSPANAEFVRWLGCYHHVVTYDRLADLPDGASAYVDVAGDASVTRAVHGHYGRDLTHSMILGGTHWDAPREVPSDLPGPAPQLFFAPAHIAERTKEWGREGLDERVGAAWRRYRDWASGWLELRWSVGPDEVERTYREVLAGRVDPRVGHLCRMAGE